MKTKCFLLKPIIAITFLLLTCTSNFAHDFEVDNIFYNIISDSTVEVTFKGYYDTQYTEYFDSIIIPDRVLYNNTIYKVTAIGADAFAVCQSLYAIKLPETIQSIGKQAFIHCIKLDTITGANFISTVGARAFHNTKWYSNQPKGFIYFRNVLYAYTDEISPNSSINITDGTVSITEGVFKNFSNITSINFSKSFKHIGAYAFQNCHGLTSITIPDSVESIGFYAFEFCKKLRFANIPKSITYIGGRLFFNCFSLETIFFDASNCNRIDYAGKGITNIILGNCNALKTIILGESLSTIPYYCFYGIPNLEKIISLTQTPPICSSSNFNWDTPSKTSLYVKSDCYSSYFLDNYWGTFNIKKISTPATTLNFNVQNMEVPLNQQNTIKATITPSNTTLPDLIWLSNNPSVACVDNKGNVDGISDGNAIISAYTIDGSNLFASCYISVKQINIESISVSQDYATLSKNETLTLYYSILPNNATNKTVTWNSSNKSVADFKTNSDESITVVGISDGITTISATTNDGTNLVASCKITVGVGGVDNIETDNNAIEIARYDIHGRLLNQPSPGINIIKYSDGSSQKEFIK